MATIKTAHNVLDLHNVLTCDVNEHSRSATSCCEKACRHSLMSPMWPFQQPFENAVISCIILIISVLMRVFISVNIRIESIFDVFHLGMENSWVV